MLCGWRCSSKWGCERAKVDQRRIYYVWVGITPYCLLDEAGSRVVKVGYTASDLVCVGS